MPPGIHDVLDVACVSFRPCGMAGLAAPVPVLIYMTAVPSTGMTINLLHGSRGSRPHGDKGGAPEEG